MSSHTTTLAPTRRARAGISVVALPCNGTSGLPSPARRVPSACTAACSKARRCIPTRAKPQRVASSGGGWQNTGIKWVAPQRIAAASAGWSCRRRSRRNQNSTVLMRRFSPCVCARCGSAPNSTSPRPRPCPTFCASETAGRSAGRSFEEGLVSCAWAGRWVLLGHKLRPGWTRRTTSRRSARAQACFTVG